MESHWGLSVLVCLTDEPLATNQLGGSTPDAAKCLTTVVGANGYGDGSNTSWGPRASLTSFVGSSGMEWAVPAGKYVNIFLSSGYQPGEGGNIMGWGVSGRLIDAP